MKSNRKFNETRQRNEGDEIAISEPKVHGFSIRKSFSFPLQFLLIPFDLSKLIQLSPSHDDNNN